ncbi:nuclear transport factor 2 family protein [Pedobacter sp. L105]|uniref:YybH family protein n=1 Tax=Pedobacter sp. L105 TaxID=1641871 RepID=UPI00131CA9F6|nr:nuclear transport factor 2 family protein [Pedobacter sp. L105]
MEMDTTTEKSAIEKLIFSFSEAFNASDILKAMSFYATDAILMPNNGPLAKGYEAIKATYEMLSKNFEINIEYFIDEVNVNGDYAYVRTNSKVSTLIRASGQTISLKNKEMFVLHKDTHWKISHYIFNNTHQE